MFEDLKGIEKEREEKVETSNLEKLIEIGNWAIKKYRRRNFDKRYKVHEDMYKDLLKKQPEFTEADLKSYVLAKANSDYEQKERLALGFYTGCLLQILTERNNEQEKRTRIYINGHGNRFDNLFDYARTVDDLIIDNFQGEHICHGIGINGNVNSLTILNCKGYGIASEIGAYGGKAGIILLANNNGFTTGSGTSFKKGKTGLFLLTNNEGDNPAGSLANNEGEIDLALFSKHKGNTQYFMIANNKGKINKIFMLDNDSDTVAYFAGEKKGKIGYFLISNNTGSRIGTATENKKNVKTLVLHNTKASSPILFAKKIIQYEEAEQEYKKSTEKYKIKEMLALTEALSGKTPDEMFAIIDKIEETYNSVKNV
ncbi:hypothetical protein KY325_01695 [Candidatus Woesearchaeota archaeon]|nr:hypothetical protein [Candidatus Woesearchaeota archaeon]